MSFIPQSTSIKTQWDAGTQACKSRRGLGTLAGEGEVPLWGRLWRGHRQYNSSSYQNTSPGNTCKTHLKYIPLLNNSTLYQNRSQHLVICHCFHSNVYQRLHLISHQHPPLFQISANHWTDVLLPPLTCSLLRHILNNL